MNQYDQIKYIGKGSYGEVYLVVDNNTNKKYAMKVIQKNEKQEQYEKLRQEGEILQQLNHKNIIKLEQMQENQDKIFLIMDYIENGNLTKLIKEKNQESEYFSEIQISQIIKGLLRGLKYIHDKNIIHRDLKTDNILIQDKNDLESVKIIDFGLCIQFQKENNIKYSSKYCGTQLYMAPELFQHKIYSRPVDIYSIGIIMYMLINKGQHPFYKDNDSFDSFQQKVINQNWNLSNMSKLAQDLFQKLTYFDPEERYTASQALEHPWITGESEINIPLTSKEYDKYFEKQKQFCNYLQIINFFKYLQKTQNKIQKIDDLYEYKIINYNECNKRFQDISLGKQYLQQLFGDPKCIFYNYRILFKIINKLIIEIKAC